ncbi:MAG: hypothetical protein K2O39_03840 [Clostridiales bacterium]|nr:hypothetical protein [Clostridiales bacterium]
MKKIAEVYNGEKECTQTLDARTEYLIKTSILSILKNRDDIAEAKLSDAKIVKFYGEYSGCYIVKIDSNYWNYTADVVNEWFYIAGIAFHKNDHLSVKVGKRYADFLV